MKTENEHVEEVADLLCETLANAGTAYAIIRKTHDASVSDLHVRNNFGFVVQWGAEYAKRANIHTIEVPGASQAIYVSQ